jgi:hypothetical protein
VVKRIGFRLFNGPFLGFASRMNGKGDEDGMHDCYFG